MNLSVQEQEAYAELLMLAPACHAGAGHDAAASRGASGMLCDRCFAAYLRIIHRGAVSLLHGGQVGFQREAPALTVFRVVPIDERTPTP